MNLDKKSILAWTVLIEFFVALVSTFLNHLYIKSSYFPVGLLVAIFGNILLCRLLFYSNLLIRSYVALFPLFMWIIITLVFLAKGPGGDILFPLKMGNYWVDFVNHNFIFLVTIPVLIYYFCLKRLSLNLTK